MRRGRIARLLLALLLAASAIFAVRQGVVPQNLLPLPAIELDDPSPWFLDWRLAALRHAPETCRAVLRSPAVEATPTPGQRIENGCGWENAFRISSAGGARIAIDKLTCPTAAGLAMWLTHVVQPAARMHLGQSVASIRHFGSYSCRNIAGSKYLSMFRSEHATANAIDIASFTLANGRAISVAGNWKGAGPEAQFLHEIHSGACRYFRVAIGPNYNAAHADHFHYDRGPSSVCR